MQVSVETTQGLERRLTITVPADKVEKEINSRLAQLAKTRRIDGFRPGKAPMAIIKKMYGETVAADTADSLIQRHFIEAVIAQKLSPAGAPTVQPNELASGKDFVFTATFEVYPEVEVKNLDTIKVEKPVATVQDADLEKIQEAGLHIITPVLVCNTDEYNKISILKEGEVSPGEDVLQIS